MGGAGNDLFQFTSAYFVATAFVNGDGLLPFNQAPPAGENDTVQITTAASITDAAFTNVNNIETLQLGNFVNSVTLSTNARASMTNLTLTIDDTAATTAGNNLTITASALTAADHLKVLGGVGNDVFTFSSTGLGSNISIDGGAGTDTIAFSDASATVLDAAFTHVSHVETIKLTSNGVASVTLGAFANADADSVGGTLTLDA
jgi:hypothetical protein